jgi:hypothetical protein
MRSASSARTANGTIARPTAEVMSSRRFMLRRRPQALRSAKCAPQNAITAPRHSAAMLTRQQCYSKTMTYGRDRFMRNAIPPTQRSSSNAQNRVGELLPLRLEFRSCGESPVARKCPRSTGYGGTHGHHYTRSADRGDCRCAQGCTNAERVRLAWKDSDYTATVNEIPLTAVVLNPRSHRIRSQLESAAQKDVVARDPSVRAAHGPQRPRKAAPAGFGACVGSGRMTLALRRTERQV